MHRPAGLLVGVCLWCALAAPLRGQQVKEPDPDSLARLVAVDSNDAQLHFQLAMALIKRTRYDDAERQLRESIVIAPHFAEAYLALSYVPMLRGDTWWKQRRKGGGQAAVEAAVLDMQRQYRRAFLLNPLVGLDRFVSLGRVKEQTPTRRVVAEDGRAYWVTLWWWRPFAMGINRMQDGDYQAAFDTLNRVIPIARGGVHDGDLPDMVMWYYALAAAHVGRWDDAIWSMGVLTGRAVADSRSESVTEIPLRANEYRQTLGTLYLLSGDLARATSVFRRALEFDLGLFSAHGQLARIHEATQRWDDAIRERQSAVDANPDDPALVVELGSTQLNAGRPADAEVTLLVAERANPRDPGAPFLRGLAAARAGHPDAAREAFARFLAIAPRSFTGQIATARQQLEALPAR
jgi:Tfp pilus assembly protein PilF